MELMSEQGPRTPLEISMQPAAQAERKQRILDEGWVVWGEFIHNASRTEDRRMYLAVKFNDDLRSSGVSDLQSAESTMIINLADRVASQPMPDNRLMWSGTWANTPAQPIEMADLFEEFECYVFTNIDELPQ